MKGLAIRRRRDRRRRRARVGAGPRRGRKFVQEMPALPSVGADAKNKVGPVLNGLEGRKSGTIEGYNYTEANKNSGITWDEKTFPRIHHRSARQDSRHQDGVRRHQERERAQQPVGLPQAVRRQGREEVMSV